MTEDDTRDRLIDLLLREEFGRETPPNLAERILRAAEKGTRKRAPVRLERWKIPALLAATIALAVLCGLVVVRLRSGSGVAQGPVEGGAKKDDLARGESLTTDDVGRAIQLGIDGYCRVELSPRTQVIRKGGVRAEELYLTRGAMVCEVDKSVGSFSVQSSVGTVTVTGTKFSVRVPEAKGGANMSVKKMLVRVIAGAVVLSGAFGELALAADQEGGTVTGIVTSKGESWIAVKAEGQDEATMYMPFWRGGQPKDGGGFDKEMLAKVKGVAVGSKVRLAWKMEEHPRIANVDVLAAPERPVEVAAATRREGGDRPHDGDRPRDGEKRRMEGEMEKRRSEIEGEKRRRMEGEMEKRRAEVEGERRKMDGEKHGEGEKRPADKARHEEGGDAKTLVGVVSAKGENWIEVKTKDDAEAQRFYPRGAGKEMDRDILRAFQKVKVNEWVKIDYVRGDEHFRATKVQLAPK